MKLNQLFIAGLVVMLYASSRAFACQCAGTRSSCQEYWEATAVFSGTVIESRQVTVSEGTYSHEMRAVRLSIDQPFRGVEGAEVEVLTGFGGGDCGFGFRQTGQYLVYAYRSEQDQKLHTSICTRTRLLSDAKADLAYIRGLAKARPGGTISGEVAKYLRDANGTLANQPMSGVKVTFAGPDNYEAMTDTKGRFRVAGVAAGEYTVKPLVPPALGVRGPDHNVTVADKGCAEIDLWLESNAQLSGRVLNPQGLPVAKAEIFMIEADKERYRGGHWDAAYADDDGKYSFKFIPPGRYVLHIRFDGLTSQTRPFPAMYYPGVTDRSQAKVFTFREGEVENYDIQVPPLPPESEIRGVVTWSDGRFAPTARVELEIDAVVYGTPIDNQGQFSFKAYQGLTLVLRASAEIEKGKYVYSDWARITVGMNDQPIKLLLPIANQ
jgi:hypothetical protein